MPHSLIYVTFGSEENAKEVAKSLVEERLVSCANIFPAIQSIYSRDDKVQEDQEIVVIFKTRSGLFSKVEEHIKQLHTYETPCIIAIQIENGSAKFLEWIDKETAN